MNLDSIKDIGKVYVFKAAALAGTITRTTSGSIFEYDKSYLNNRGEDKIASICFSMSLSQGAYETSGDNLHPFFAGLLPEGLRLTALVSALKTSADDMFSLLAAVGVDCIGDVRVMHEPALPVEGIDREIPNFDSISFYELFEQSISAKDYSWRIRDGSIAGVQPKISAEMISFPVSIKKKNKRYILKLSPEAFPRLVQNENFFMEMAKDCGLEVANTSIVKDRDETPGLLVERFDCHFDAESKEIKRLHQEDSCQFLSRYPHDKYRLTMRDIAEGISEYCTAPQIDTTRLLELKAFSYIIANGDLHAKNISIYRHPVTNRVMLTPAYDLVSTLPYGDQTMALQMEGRKDKLRAKHFIQFGMRQGVKEAAIKSMLKRLTKKAVSWVKRVDEIGLEKKKTDFLKKKMSERLEHLS